MWRYEHDAQKADECGKLIKFQEVEIQKGLGVEVHLRNENEALNKTIVSQNTELALAKGELSETKGQLDNQKKLTRHEKKQKGKFKWAFFAAISYIIIEKVSELP